MSDGMIANRGGPDDYPVYEGDKHYCVDPAGETFSFQGGWCWHRSQCEGGRCWHR